MIIVARRFGCKSMVGVDIDARLVGRANSKLQLHHKTPAESPDRKEEVVGAHFPNNVTFRGGNILDDTVESQEACYDVVVW